MTRQHLADTLGTSLVTFDRTLQRLRATMVFTFIDRRLEILDDPAMMVLAAVDGTGLDDRPLI